LFIIRVDQAQGLQPLGFFVARPTIAIRPVPRFIFVAQCWRFTHRESNPSGLTRSEFFISTDWPKKKILRVVQNTVKTVKNRKKRWINRPKTVGKP
jgi:hypothetical protein